MPGGLAFPRLRAAYALLASGVLVDADARGGGDAAGDPDGDGHLPALRPAAPARSQRARRRCARRCADELERSAHLDREAWLKVSREAPREELVKALEEKMERYHALLRGRRRRRGSQDRPRGDPRPRFGDAAPRAPGPRPREAGGPAPAAPRARAPVPAAGLRRRRRRAPAGGGRTDVVRGHRQPDADRAPRHGRRSADDGVRLRERDQGLHAPGGARARTCPPTA